MGDKFFKENCCHPGVVEVLTREYCNKFTQRRPTDDGTNYRSPNLGEPHSNDRSNITTVILL